VQRSQVVAVFVAGLLLPAGVGFASAVDAALPPAPAVGDGHIAFTDETQSLQEYRAYDWGSSDNAYPEETSSRFSGSDTGAAADEAPADAREASSTLVQDGSVTTQVTAYISTADSSATDRGDIVVTTTPDGGPVGDPVLVTCDGAPKSHPVVSDDGLSIAYAMFEDGSWDVVRRDVPTGQEDACDDDSLQVVAGGPGDQLWPAWLPGGVGLVYSDTRDDPRGDLWLLRYDGDQPMEPQRLTDDPGADVQATVSTGSGECRPIVAFVTTRYRADGSLAFLPLPAESDNDSLPETVDAYRDHDAARIQGAEPAWAPADGGGAQLLAFTSTQENPRGGAWIGSWDIDCQQAFYADQSAMGYGTDQTSHPTWLTPMAPPCDCSYSSAFLLVTATATSSDIADVRARDGAQRRTLVAGTRTVDPDSSSGPRDPLVDEEGPSYSPDGTQIVFAQDGTPPPDDEEYYGPLGATLATAPADGGAATPLDYGWTNLDTDTDPVWSPDGTTIAFVRSTYQPGAGIAADTRAGPKVAVGSDDAPSGPDVAAAIAQEPDDAVVMLLDVATGTVRPLDDLPGGESDPSWSPDGTQLVLTRHVDGPDGTQHQDTNQVWTVDVATGAAAALLLTRPCGSLTCGSFTAPVEGRTPAWSPDGTRIAVADLYVGGRIGIDRRGAISVVDLRPGTAPAVGTDVHPVTGDDDPSVGLVGALDPAWSEDGGEISFTGEPTGLPRGEDLWAVAPDGTGLRRLTDRPGAHSEPVWQHERVATTPVVTPTTTTPTAPTTPTTSPGPAPTTSAPVPPPAPQGVSVRVHLSHHTAWLGGEPITATFTVRNEGGAPAADVRLATSFPTSVVPDGDQSCLRGGAACALGDLAVGDSRTLTATLTTTGTSGDDAVVGAVVGHVTTTSDDPDPSDDRDRARLEVLFPQLTVVPAVARPGEVVLVVGEDLPPGEQVVMDWDPGITNVPGPFTVDADGMVKVPLLLMRDGRLGDRVVGASVGEGRPVTFGPIQAPMLVVPSTADAPSFVFRK